MKVTLLMTAIVFTLLHLKFNFSVVDFSQNSENGIEFHQGSWNEALELARKENKVIFLDVYASWCGPCKLMKRKTFAEKQVGEYFNSRFINVSMDGEMGEGRVLFKEFGIKAYPSLLFVDAEGNLLIKKEGYHSPAQLNALGKKVLKE
ncbi:hypothetical protein BH23BAC2_BH23BAC2_00420 [soil metagenome]